MSHVTFHTLSHNDLKPTVLEPVQAAAGALILAAASDVQKVIKVASDTFEMKLEDSRLSMLSLSAFAELVGDAKKLCKDLHDLSWSDDLAAAFDIVLSFTEIVKCGCLTKTFLEQSDMSAWEFSPEDIMNRMENLQNCPLWMGKCDFSFLEMVVAPKMHTIKVEIQAGPWATLAEAKGLCDIVFTGSREEDQLDAAEKLILTLIHHIFEALLLVLVTWSSYP